VRTAWEWVPIDGGAALVAILVLFGIRVSQILIDRMIGFIKIDRMYLVHLVQSCNPVKGFSLDQSQ
jgi:hypothetical protein